MNAFWNLFKLDWMLIHRNKIILISAGVTAIYTLLFNALSGVDQVEKFLILIIFNDPALLGVLFVGVMVLFEKNERSLQALSVTPVRWSHYLWSKTLALTLIALLCCYAMAFATLGWDLHWGHFTTATLLTTMLFSFIGFVAVAGEATFNTYMLKAAVVILVLAIPFIGYFGVVPFSWFMFFPTYYVLLLFDVALGIATDWTTIVLGYVGSIIWTAVIYKWALHRFVQKSILA